MAELYPQSRMERAHNIKLLEYAQVDLDRYVTDDVGWPLLCSLRAIRCRMIQLISLPTWGNFERHFLSVFPAGCSIHDVELALTHSACEQAVDPAFFWVVVNHEVLPVRDAIAYRLAVFPEPVWHGTDVGVVTTTEAYYVFSLDFGLERPVANYHPVPQHLRAQ